MRVKNDTRVTKEYHLKMCKQMRELGQSEGELKEARRSLSMRFTEPELKELFSLFWFGAEMQSIRSHLAKHNEEIKELKEP